MIRTYFKINQTLLFLFALIRIGGYEGGVNNQKDFHLRTFSYFIKPYRNRKLEAIIKKYLQNSLKDISYRYLINKYFSKKIQDKPNFDKLLNLLIKQYHLNKYFKQIYLPTVESITSHQNKKLKIVTNYTIKVLNLSPSQVRGQIAITLNLLDERCRGSFHQQPKSPHIISISLNKVDKIPWATLRHELMHYILKQKIKSQFDDHHPILTIAPEYANDNLRNKLDEYIIRAINNRLIKQDLGEGWYKQQLTREINSGFVLMPQVSYFIEETIFKRKQSINKNWYERMIKYLTIKNNNTRTIS